MQKLQTDTDKAREQLIVKMKQIYNDGSFSEKGILEKAYRQLSIDIHPDHFPIDERAQATENFKVFAQA